MSVQPKTLLRGRQAGASWSLPRAFAGSVNVVHGKIPRYISAFARNTCKFSRTAHDLGPALAATAFRYVAIPSKGKKINLVTLDVRKRAWRLQVNDTIAERAHDHDALCDARLAYDKGRTTALQDRAGSDERPASDCAPCMIDRREILVIALQHSNAACILRFGGRCSLQGKQHRHRNCDCRHGSQSRHGRSFPAPGCHARVPLVSLAVRQSHVERDPSNFERLGNDAFDQAWHAGSPGFAATCRRIPPGTSRTCLASRCHVREGSKGRRDSRPNRTSAAPAHRQVATSTPTTGREDPSIRPCCIDEPFGCTQSGVDAA